jgi:8-oxo-dGTP diphosphatase
MPVGRFACGISALIWNRETDQYLLLKRASHRDAGAGAWECVTGRVDQGESFEQAVYREIHEELGVNSQIEFIIGTSHFYRGETVPENEMLGVRYLCTLDNPAMIRITNEHSEYRWLTAEEVNSLLSPEHWLISAIRDAEMIKQVLTPERQAFYRAE